MPTRKREIRATRAGYRGIVDPVFRPRNRFINPVVLTFKSRSQTQQERNHSNLLLPWNLFLIEPPNPERNNAVRGVNNEIKTFKKQNDETKINENPEEIKTQRITWKFRFVPSCHHWISHCRSMIPARSISNIPTLRAHFHSLPPCLNIRTSQMARNNAITIFHAQNESVVCQLCFFMLSVYSGKKKIWPRLLQSAKCSLMKGVKTLTNVRNIENRRNDSSKETRSREERILRPLNAITASNNAVAEITRRNKDKIKYSRSSRASRVVELLLAENNSATLALTSLWSSSSAIDDGRCGRMLISDVIAKIID